MNFKLKLSFVTIICITLMVGCQKETQLTPNAANPMVKRELDNFVQSYFENKYQLLVDATPSETHTKRMISFASTKAVAEKTMKEIDDLKAVRTMASLKFIGYTVKTEIDYSTWKNEGDKTSFNVKLFYSYTTNGTDEHTGEAISPAGYELYSFTVSKQDQNWSVVKQEQTFDTYYNPGVVSTEADEPAYMEKSMAAYTYNGTTAAAFAIAHWNLVSNVSNYCDYTNWGGDCTNFTSRCLRQGGWKHVNYWFYNSNGSSGNSMSLYHRSPSWAGANMFYKYISGTGAYAGCNGNNRATQKFANLNVPFPNSSFAQWTAFYNVIKQMKKGDIVELGDGATPATIHHNMIVSKTQSTPPYVFVSYRNATGYLPAGDRPINEMWGRTLYGFYIKPSGI